MIRRPEIYISAASLDLGIAVNLVRSEVLQIGATPVHVDAYPGEWGAAWSLMEHHISKCDAFIHLAGDCFGSQPENRPAAEPCRSYTQMELAMAKSLGKPVFPFVCGPDFPLLSHPEESLELHQLQKSHRNRLVRHHGEQALVAGVEELRMAFRRLRPTLEEMMQAFVDRDRTLRNSFLETSATKAKSSSVQTESGSTRPPGSKSNRPWHPPLAAVDFIGRTSEKENVIEHLKSVRRVSIVGARGIGKSALAAAALAEVAPGPDAPGMFAGGIFRYNFHRSPGHYAALAGILAQASLADVADTKHEAAVKQILARPNVCLMLEGCEKAEALERLLELASEAHVILEAVDPFSAPGYHEVPVHQLALEDAAFLLYRARIVAETRAQSGTVVHDGLIPPLGDPVWQTLARRLGAHPLILQFTAHRLHEERIAPADLLSTLERDGIDIFESVAAEHGSVPWIFANCSQELAKLDPGVLPAWYALSLHAHTTVPQKSLAAALGIPEEQVPDQMLPLVRRAYVTECSVQGEQLGAVEKAWTLASVA
ncbi:MAG TPA: DUF4062 domain-containing protein, partial [Verrucomicrobium sp.]|nr:DUF4062 domain-containing protein [Verrucomicrobium sp.]